MPLLNIIANQLKDPSQHSLWSFVQDDTLHGVKHVAPFGRLFRKETLIHIQIHTRIEQTGHAAPKRLLPLFKGREREGSCSQGLDAIIKTLFHRLKEPKLISMNQQFHYWPYLDP
ncbi:hypothetical protein SAMN06265219_12123 [Gracilimonas mengyeensis]|uniref:Uncharacterized protein n=1 Tax=Gracilimonas mengyeensis TaxID=1302730 RepID=A0A521FK72_9BACT|nr:hypothetical protein SAMN06265219_12123 [Gracilimonas mengyeensis]